MELCDGMNVEIDGIGNANSFALKREDTIKECAFGKIKYLNIFKFLFESSSSPVMRFVLVFLTLRMFPYQHRDPFLLP